MRSKSLLAAAFIGAALAASGCATSYSETPPAHRSAGTVIDDATITTKVKAKFIEDKAVSAMDIKVDTYNGTVQLSGFANSAAEKQRAAELARSVNGVKTVKNDIKLKSAS